MEKRQPFQQTGSGTTGHPPTKTTTTTKPSRMQTHRHRPNILHKN